MTTGGSVDESGDRAVRVRELRDDLTRFMMVYQFGLDEMLTKINILKDEFTHLHTYCPIEHVSSRLKTPDAIARKAMRKGYPLTFDGIREGVRDIAGLRIVCSFRADTYAVKDLLAGQEDVRVVEFEDYIAAPKPNGYKSIHLILELPVYLSDRVERVYTEVQIRTIAQDFWASLDHKIHYQYAGRVPESILAELTDAAAAAHALDVKMEALHAQVSNLVTPPAPDVAFENVQDQLLLSLMSKVPGSEDGEPRSR